MNCQRNRTVTMSPEPLAFWTKWVHEPKMGMVISGRIGIASAQWVAYCSSGGGV